jgi:hypothetical protein
MVTSRWAANGTSTRTIAAVPTPIAIRPSVAQFKPDAITRDVLDLVAARFPDHFGSLEDFAWPVTAAQAAQAFDRFLKTRLPLFGRYQDAMMAGADTMYHAVISPALNIGLIDPVEMCRLAETEWREGRAPIEAVEGFIRQVIGWREYVRGIYWLTMPDLAQANELDATRPCPNSGGPAKRRWPASPIAHDAQDGLCPSHPAPDGHGQFRPARRAFTAGCRRLVPGGLCRCVRMGGTAQRGGHGAIRGWGKLASNPMPPAAPISTG